MTLVYIRPDKKFLSIYEQLQYINSYAVAKNLVIDDEFVDYISKIAFRRAYKCRLIFSQRSNITDI